MSRQDAKERHTPAPWTDNGDLEGDIIGFDENGDKVYIIECDSGVYGPHGKDRPLVLAAPELLHALIREHQWTVKDAVATVSETVEEAMEWHRRRKPDCSICALIKKSKGKS